MKTIEQSTISTSYYSLLIIYLIDNYISSTLAWAAASLAIGTLNGEHDT